MTTSVKGNQVPLTNTGKNCGPSNDASSSTVVNNRQKINTLEDKGTQLNGKDISILTPAAPASTNPTLASSGSVYDALSLNDMEPSSPPASANPTLASSGSVYDTLSLNDMEPSSPTASSTLTSPGSVYSSLSSEDMEPSSPSETNSPSFTPKGSTSSPIPQDDIESISPRSPLSDEEEADFHYREAMEMLEQDESTVQGKIYIDHLQKAADLGHPRAVLQLGHDYWEGNYVKQDKGAAIKKYHEAMKLGNSDAMDYLFIAIHSCYNSKVRVDIDPKIAQDVFKKLEKQAKKSNSPMDLYRLGLCYKEGFGTQKDGSAAFRCFVMVYNGGTQDETFFKAALEIAQCLQDGFGVQKDLQKRLELLEALSSLGNAEAQFLCGEIYLYGRGVEKDKQKAILFLNTAQLNRHREARLELTKIYHDDANYDGAKQLFKKCVAEANDSDPDSYYQISRYARLGLGSNNWKSPGVVDINYPLMNFYLNLASSLGHVQATFELAVSHENGIGMKMDRVKAFELYKRAADLGHSEAMFQLAVCYQKGYGVKQDTVAAEGWMKKAKDAGFISNSKLFEAPAAIAPKQQLNPTVVPFTEKELAELREMGPLPQSIPAPMHDHDEHDDFDLDPITPHSLAVDGIDYDLDSSVTK